MPVKLILFAFVGAICSWHYVNGGPTLVPADPFEASKDVKILWDAVDGVGTDEDDVNKVLCQRTFLQRVEIAQTLEAEHKGQKLFERLEKETSGDLKKLYRRLLESPQQILAKDLHDYIDGLREDKYGGVTEIICGTDLQDKAALAAYYNQTYNMDVMVHAQKYKSGDKPYQAVLSNFCWRKYCITPTLTAPQATAAAQLLKNIDTKTDKESLRVQLQNYFRTYCLPDLQAIFIYYRSLCNRGIEDAIRECIKGDEADAWVALTFSTENRYRYYANLLHSSVDGGGTDEDRVNRIVLQTCERYLGDIDCEYKAIHSESFVDRLTKWNGGDCALHINVKDCMRKLFGRKD